MSLHSEDITQLHLSFHCCISALECLYTAGKHALSAVHSEELQKPEGKIKKKTLSPFK